MPAAGAGRPGGAAVRCSGALGAAGEVGEVGRLPGARAHHNTSLPGQVTWGDLPAIVATGTDPSHSVVTLLFIAQKQTTGKTSDNQFFFGGGRSLRLY